jgi:RHS repeat-associated protein
VIVWRLLRRYSRSSFTSSPTDADFWSHDHSGRLAAKIIDGVTTHYLYFRQDVIEEYQDDGSVTASYTPGRRIAEILLATINGVGYSLHHNAIGHVVPLADSAGAILQRYHYEIHGHATVLDAGGNTIGDVTAAISPYLFTGRRLKRETGLYYVRARFYSTALGRFISQDPLVLLRSVVSFVKSAGRPR